MNVIKVLNTTRNKEVYHAGDIVRIVGLKSIVYTKEDNDLDIGTICKVIQVRPKNRAKCKKQYCDLSSYNQCIKFEAIEKTDIYNKNATWTCYGVIERLK